MGIVVTEASPERVVATMPVSGNRQPYGLLHGGASVVLAETVGSLGAAVTAGADRAAVGIEINATHHRSATSGTVTGIGTRLHAGRSLITFEVRVVDERDRAVCSCRITCMVLAKPPSRA
nr:hotdog fold thioesterase [Micromonospora sp. DSM 115978]